MIKTRLLSILCALQMSLGIQAQTAKAQGEFETATEAVKNMKVGWNLGSLSNDDVKGYIETEWGQPLIKPELMKMMRKAGFNVIRLHVTWYPRMDTNGKVDSRWMLRVHELVDYVVDQGMYCILNTALDCNLNTTGDNGAWLMADKANYEQNHERFEYLWKQIAEEFKDYDQHLIFEAFNEMLDKYDSWVVPSGDYGQEHIEQAYKAVNDYVQSFVNAVRSTGGNNQYRNLMANIYSSIPGPDDWSAEAMRQMNIPQDLTNNHFIFGIHTYWMGNKDEVDGVINNIKKYITSKGIPTVVGEWGAFGFEQSFEDYHAYFVKQAKANGIATILCEGMCTGIMRDFPIFDDAKEAEFLLKAYYGDSYEPKLITIDDYDYQGISVSFDPQGTLVVLGENLDLNVYKGIRIGLDDNLDGLTLIAAANWEGKEQHFPISSASETYYFDQSILGDAIISIALWNNKNEKNKTRVINSYLIKHDGTERLVPLYRYYGWDSKTEIVMSRKQYVHTVSFDGLWSELNIFSDDIPLKQKYYKGIRLELAEMPEDDTFQIVVCDDENEKYDWIGLDGTSTTILFNTELFSNEINRIVLQHTKESKDEVKVISAWLIRQDGTEEYSDLSPRQGCEITNVVKIGKSNGDVNGDWKLDVADIVAMENYINKKPTLKFNTDAADLNNDGKINQTDVNILVNMILSAQKQ